MFYQTCNLTLMPFYSYKSYQRFIRQHFYMNNKYNKNTTTYLNTIQWKHNNIPVCLQSIKSVFVAPPFLLIRSAILGFEDVQSYTIPGRLVLHYTMMFGLTLYHISHTRFYVSSFKHGSWLPISFFVIFQTFFMVIISSQFPGHFRTGISLHSKNVLVLIGLWHGARSYIKIYPFYGNTAHSHKSVFHSHSNRQHCRVWRKQNEEYHAKCIQATVKSPVRKQVWEAISSRCLSLPRKVNGNMDSAKYQSDIIHAIEILCELVVFPKKGSNFIHDLAPCHNSKITRTFKECKGIPILEWPENLRDMNPIQNVWNIMKKEIGNKMPCKKEEMWKPVCETWNSVALNVLEELKNSMPRSIADLIKAKGDAKK